MKEKLGVWFSTPNFMFAEMARDLNFHTVVLDYEHGTFGSDDLDRFIPFAVALGFEVLVKTLGPTPEAIQQSLDFGAHGVIIPHVLDLEHARHVTAAAKYPPLGTRSWAGGRINRYGAATPDFFDDENRRTRCYPMVESKEALADMEAILPLPTVDGVFLGPSDLSLSRGRGKYSFGDDDKEDILKVVAAAKSAAKPWIMPAWSRAERLFSHEHGADLMVVVEEQGALLTGLQVAAEAVMEEIRHRESND
ncbi:MAG: hypothetical protein H0W76_01795 [Pyrinomonadaceae bacterium]|nr:hypothetical protein [Pyrinomonadaceae bacterium]